MNIGSTVFFLQVWTKGGCGMDEYVTSYKIRQGKLISRDEKSSIVEVGDFFRSLETVPVKQLFTSRYALECAIRDLVAPEAK